MVEAKSQIGCRSSKSVRGGVEFGAPIFIARNRAMIRMSPVVRAGLDDDVVDFIHLNLRTKLRRTSWMSIFLVFKHSKRKSFPTVFGIPSDKKIHKISVFFFWGLE